MGQRDVYGPACPQTGRTVADELLVVVTDLACVGVYDRDGVRYNDQEYRAYCDGYYRAVAQAARVMEAALERRRLRLHATRPGQPAPSEPRRRTVPRDRGRARSIADRDQRRGGARAALSAGAARRRSGDGPGGSHR